MGETPAEASAYRQLAVEVGDEAAYQAWLTVQVRRRYRQDFAAFCREVLDYADLLPAHDALCRWMQAQAESPKLVLMPRYSFKSSICTIGYALWCLLRDPNERILVYSDTTEKAEGFLLEIKNHILGLTKGGGFRALTHDQPWDVDPQVATWNQSAIVIRARTQAAREPSVDTAGIETSKVGMHYDRILFDDIVSDKNVTTREQMEKVRACYTTSLSLLKPGGDLVMVGTRWHFGDLYGWILDENRRCARWQVHLRKADEGGQYPFAPIGLTPAFLAQKRLEQGSRLHSVLYQNEPVDDETATFKASDFRFYRPADVPIGLFITCCLDPIPPHEGTAGDDAALTVVGTDHELTLYVLDLVAGRLQPSEQIEAILQLHATWGLQVVGVETNAFQKVMRRDLEYRIQQERRKNPHFRFFQVEEFSGVSLPNKELRIRGLQPYHERGALRFPGESVEQLTGHYATLAWQMLQFPHAAKDDLVDSLAGHIRIHRAGTQTPVRTELPHGSAAWFEREVWLKDHLKTIRRMPRWQRPRLPQLAFS